MDAWLNSLKNLAVDPASNYQALGIAIAIVVIFVTITVLALIIGALSGPSSDRHGKTAPAPIAVDTLPRQRTTISCAGFLIWILIALLGAASAAGIWYRVTSTPEYCGRSCHQMSEASAKWASSAHSEIACVQCHEESGLDNIVDNSVTRIDHIYVAMMKSRTKKRPVPARRCLACHTGIIDAALTARNGETFVHRKDAKDQLAECDECHGNQGHEPR